MKKTILIIYTIILTIFLVSCSNPKYNMPKLNDKIKVNLTEDEYLKIINGLTNIEHPIEIGKKIEEITEYNDPGIKKQSNKQTKKYISTTKLDKDNNAVETINYNYTRKYLENDEKIVETNKAKRINYYHSKSDKLYFNLNQKTKTSGNFRSNNTKGKFFEEKEPENQYNYDFNFSDSIIKSERFLKIVLSDYPHLKLYKTREMFIINFKYTKELAKNHQPMIDDFIKEYQNNLIQEINFEYDFEFTLSYKENKFFSFNIVSYQNRLIDLTNRENSIKIYIRSDSKPPKFPNFNKFKQYDLDHMPII